MRRLVSRYTHVPLAAASVVVLAVVIAWLLMDRLGGPWPRWRGLATPAPSVVAIPAVPDSGRAARRRPSGPRTPGPREASPRVPVVPRPPAPALERYALESGPFVPGEAADRLEGELNRLGHATVRFRKEDTARLFVVTATGFASSDEARQAVRELGRGTVVEEAGVAEIVLGPPPVAGRGRGGGAAAARPGVRGARQRGAGAEHASTTSDTGNSRGAPTPRRTGRRSRAAGSGVGSSRSGRPLPAAPARCVPSRQGWWPIRRRRVGWAAPRAAGPSRPPRPARSAPPRWPSPGRPSPRGGSRRGRPRR